jgi:hypothetical protein
LKEDGFIKTWRAKDGKVIIDHITGNFIAIANGDKYFMALKE